jgi:homoserine O-succinyltransferase
MQRLTIGLVNNMPDAALRTTERQFRQLLTLASPDVEIRLRVYRIPGHVRSERALAYLRLHCRDVDELWSGDAVDGLIVTGTEPRVATLEDEPFWPVLTRLFAWAQDHAVPTVLSCLAAHAAVLYFDGIRRRELPQKLCGVYLCAKSATHPVLDGLPPTWVMPHSRSNDVPEAMLVARGYTILSRAPEAGADMFVPAGASPFLFIQGHPEYDAGALLREYRRDVARFLAGERDDYPILPTGYFDAAAMARCEAFETRVRATRDRRLLSQFPVSESDRGLVHAWREPALRLYGNWLAAVAARASSSRRQTAPSLTAAR